MEGVYTMDFISENLKYLRLFVIELSNINRVNIFRLVK